MTDSSGDHGRVSFADKDPMYIRVCEALREAISANAYPSGRLPTERVLGVRYGVSLGTMRKAMDLLVQEGIITRRQGSGTYISRRVAVPSLTGARRTHMLCYISGTRTEASIGSFFNQLMVAVQHEVEGAGYATVLAGIKEGKVPMPVLKQKVDGVLMAGTYAERSNPERITWEEVRANNRLVTRMGEVGLPVVAINNPTDCQAVQRVDPDYDDALHTALSYLKEHGHQRVAIYGGPRQWPAFGQRIEAFLRQAKAVGLEVGEHLVRAYDTWVHIDPRGAVRAVRDHLRGGCGATAAIVASGSDKLVRQGIVEAGVQRPEDFHLVTFKDVYRLDGRIVPAVDADEGAQAEFAVAWLEVPVHDLARAAVNRLVALLEGHTFPPEQRQILVPMPFVTADAADAAGAPKPYT